MENRNLGRKIKVLANQIRRKIEKDLANQSIKIPSTQSRIIGFLYKESPKRDIFQKDIEEAFGIRRSSVTNVVQLMDKNGYIERVSVAEDARLKKIILTDKGLKVQKMVVKVLEEAENSLREVYSEEELSQLFYLLDKLSHTLGD